MSSARVAPKATPPGVRHLPAFPGPARASGCAAARFGALLASLLSLGGLALAPTTHSAYADEPAPSAPAGREAPLAPPLASDPLVIGTYPLGAHMVVDGDTLRVPGEPPIRILALDCEEVLRNQDDRRAAEADFDAYARAKRADSPTPVKYGTPAGEAARVYVHALLAGATSVRLERDILGGHDFDSFGRRLAHVIVLQPTGARNLAAEVIRAGHSPYFVKYGRARRFHADFVAAQAEARAAKRGIWGEGGARHYPDYEERLRWWEARAQQVDAWHAAPDAPERIELGTLEADRRLAARVGKPVLLFGPVARARTDGWPRLLYLTHKQDADVPLVVRDEAVWKALEPAIASKRFLTVRGELTLYRGLPQVEISDATQVSTP